MATYNGWHAWNKERSGQKHILSFSLFIFLVSKQLMVSCAESALEILLGVGYDRWPIYFLWGILSLPQPSQFRYEKFSLRHIDFGADIHQR